MGKLASEKTACAAFVPRPPPQKKMERAAAEKARGKKKLRVRDVELGGSGEDNEEAPGMVACLGKEQRARGCIQVSKQTCLISEVKRHSGSTLPATGVIAKVFTLAARVKAQQLVPRWGAESHQSAAPQRLRQRHARWARAVRPRRAKLPTQDAQ